MQEQIIATWDDLVYGEQCGRKVPADVTIVLAIDGEARKLDLTSDNAEAIREQMGSWMRNGRKLDPGESQAVRRGRAGPNPGSIIYNRQMRSFGTARGLEWHKSGSAYRHSRALVKAYAAFLADGGNPEDYS